MMALVVISRSLLFSIHDAPLSASSGKEDSLPPSSKVTKPNLEATIQANPIFQAEYDRIDQDVDLIRCQRYNYTYNQSSSTNRRRLFFGAMVADDENSMKIHATEAYNIYHVVTFVESNTTHMGTPRSLRFSHHDAVQRVNRLFGPQTTVTIDFWLEDQLDATGMVRETLQRDVILNVWKQQGMTPQDVGIMGDLDEVYTRDFLRALQVCDIPQLTPKQDCQRPKIMPKSITFEGSPDCVAKNFWYHPDAVLGECIEGIGDSFGRPIPIRRRDHGYYRSEGWGLKGGDDYSDEVHSSGKYPLLNGPDMRMLEASYSGLVTYANETKDGIYGVAFHFHNFFANLTTLRNKYQTYGHGDKMAFGKTLSELDQAMDIVVRCAHNIRNTRGHKVRFTGDILGYAGPKPIYFLNHTYRAQRRDRMRQLVVDDEKLYGSSYSEEHRVV